MCGHPMLMGWLHGVALHMKPTAANTSVNAALHDAIAAALPGSEMRVTAGQPGHFAIAVTSKAFRGQSRVNCQRLIYKAIAHLMRGDAALVHAVDQLETSVP